MVSLAQVGHLMPTTLSRRNFAAGLLATGAALALPAGRALAQAESGEDARLMAFLREAAKREDSLDPWGVLYRGGKLDLAALRQTFTDAPLRARRSVVKWELGALKKINRALLSPERQISFDSFQHSRREAALWLQPDMLALTTVRPLVHFGGLHVELASVMSKGGPLSWTGAPDYRRNFELLRVFPQILDNAVVRFRQGLDSGVVETQMTTRNMVAQIDAMLAQSMSESQFTSAVRDFPASIPAEYHAEYKRLWEAAVEFQLYPAYRRLRAFLNDEYLPAAREVVGISAMKGGAEFYRKAIENQTTLKLEPEAIHQLGLSEVARIQREMDGVRQRLGFKGPLRAFFDDVRTNPRYHPKTKQELADAFAAAAKAVDAQVPKFFNKVPKTKLLIEPYPAFREQFEAGGSYNQGSPDGSRPGVFNYNTYDLPSRFLTGIVTLYLHEGAPGHHFQISLAQEDSSLPDFQRFGGNNAYVEGWALYSETLGYEMGFYKDPMQHWGTLDDEMLRAMRLVVDTGLHAKGWTREAAIEFMLANSGMGRSDATAEVERYIVWPGQALGYKIGALTIQRLRKKAESALGKWFDIRVFHDQVLGSGALPLPILEAKIDRWVAAAAAPA
jgi:uncharacterized protein (DUF885 family)